MPQKFSKNFGPAGGSGSAASSTSESACRGLKKLLDGSPPAGNMNPRPAGDRPLSNNGKANGSEWTPYHRFVGQLAEGT